MTFPSRARKYRAAHVRHRTAAAASAFAGCVLSTAGCSTPPDYYHTLRPIAISRASAPTMQGATRAAAHVLAIGPVTVPDALARNEWVIRVGDSGARLYEHQLWTQDLSADVAQTLVDYLGRAPLPDTLRADAGPTGSGSGADLDAPAPLRLRLQVLRFDSVLMPTPAISDEMRWTLECLPSDSKLSPVDSGHYRTVRSGTRTVATAAAAADASVEPPQQRYDQLARGHSDAVRQVADDVAAALRDSVAERAHDCFEPR